ncbi:MAG TPA: YciI family protein [Phototrophicaceae bacterium]|jgi:uncharacterized protein YciI|nr:YciI family protein [Phototrophicaceae bacterium]
MPQYLYRIQPTRMDMLIQSTPDEDRIVGEHFQQLKRLTEDGVVILAGRTLNTDDSTFGIVIFNAEDDESARTIMDDDPAVSQGVMKAELFPYRVGLIAERNAG